jgi:acyl dehydratase
MFKDWGEEQYFEDFAVGDRFKTEPVAFPLENIIAFARRYDPQRFHVDPEEAAKTMFGGIIASGWHVICETFRAAIDAGFLRKGGMSSPGITELKWLKPVRPGDRIHLEFDVTHSRPSNTRDDRGYVTLDVAAINQDGVVVMSYTVAEVVLKRP